MIAMHSAELLQIFPQPQHAVPDFSFCGVETDSRKPAAGKLFIALRGEHFDAHDYLQQAADQGVVAALVERKVDIGLAQILVADCQQAMAQLARAWRRRVAPTVVAITGSNGKTTVKEMLGRILESQAAVLKTPGNFNNAIGVPLTLFQLSSSDRFAVIEMGANHPLEIKALLDIAEPDIVYVNNARNAHLQGFGSLQGVVEAKGEMYRYAAAQSLAVFNEDEDAVQYWHGISASNRCLGFSIEGGSEVNASFNQHNNALQITIDYQQQTAQTLLQVTGRHNAQNAVAAITLAIACGIDLKTACQALDGFAGVAGRQQFLAGLNDSLIIDDSYNANPDSLAAAVRVLCQLDGEAWLAMGDMAEMGDESLALHRAALALAKELGVSEVFALGRMSCQAVSLFAEQGHCFDSHCAMSDFIAPRLHAGINLLIKGSRSAAMEKVVARLKSPLNSATGVQHAV